MANFYKLMKMIDITWYLTKDTMVIYNLSISKGKILKTIPILVYTNLVLVDIGRF